MSLQDIRDRGSQAEGPRVSALSMGACLERLRDSKEDSGTGGESMRE